MNNICTKIVPGPPILTGLERNSSGPHLLVGLGALILIQIIYMRYLRLKELAAEQVIFQSTTTQTGR